MLENWMRGLSAYVCMESPGVGEDSRWSTGRELLRLEADCKRWKEEDTGKGTEMRLKHGDTCVSFSTVNSGREVMRTVVLWNDGHQ